MAKAHNRINVLLIEDGCRGMQSLRSLLSGGNCADIKITNAVSFPLIRKSITEREVDLVMLVLPADDKRVRALPEVLKKAPALPVIVIGETKCSDGSYPFTVYEFLAYSEMDEFLLSQIIRSAAESGKTAYKFDSLIKEFQSSGVRFLNVILSNVDGILIVNKRNKILFINPAARQMLDASLREGRWNKFPYDAPPGECTEIKTGSPGGNTKVLEMRSADTSWEGREARLISLRDITSRKSAEEALRMSEERYALAIRGSKDGLWDWDLLAGKIYFHPQWKAMLGYGEKEIGENPEEWFSRIHPSEARRVKKAINNHLSGSTSSLKSEHRMLHKDGTYRWVLVRGTALRNDTGKAYRIAGSQTDITERKKAERELKKALDDLRFALASEKILMEELDRKNKELVELSITDGLTGLYNHRFLQERFDYEYKRLRRYGGPLSIMIIDIDLFKSVNDTHGHQFGDFVLRELAILLKANSREVDICGRYGGEEFMIITSLQAEEIMKYAAKLHAAVEDHVFSYSGRSIHITVSVGIAEYRNDVKTKQELIERADHALYQAKMDGRNLIRLWKDVIQQDDRTVDRRGIEEFKKQFVSISSQMRGAYMEATDALIKAVDAKDPFAREHSHTVSRYSVELAKHLCLSPSEIEVIQYAGLLHDIGKIGIKQDILTKKEQLTQKEFELLKRHPIVGCNILRDVKFLEKELPLILHHHERYDGSGYPYGLKDREIPLGARILAVADSFDAMISGRTYKKKLDRAKAFQELKDKSGTQFAPEIVNAFIKLGEMGKV